MSGEFRSKPEEIIELLRFHEFDILVSNRENKSMEAAAPSDLKHVIEISLVPLLTF